MTIEIEREEDIIRARAVARDLAGNLGFSVLDKTRVVTAVSELARNTLVHGGGGCMEIGEINDGATIGIRCVFRDEGPGIEFVDRALEDGFSTGSGLGQGLPGAKRLMDDLTITSRPGNGARVEIIKWKP